MIVKKKTLDMHDCNTQFNAKISKLSDRKDIQTEQYIYEISTSVNKGQE